jgi:hypothetical protein
MVATDFIRPVFKKIIIGNVISEPVLKNVFQLKLTHMHGDADAYTHTVHLFDSAHGGLISLSTVLVLIEAIERYYNQGDGDFEMREIRNLVEGVIRHQDPEVTQRALKDALQYFKVDCINRDRFACIDGYELIYFDEDGNKRQVAVL